MKISKEHYLETLAKLDETEFSEDLVEYSKVATLIYSSNDLIDTDTGDDIVKLCEDILGDYIESYSLHSHEKLKALIYILSNRIFSDIIGDDTNE